MLRSLYIALLNAFVKNWYVFRGKVTVLKNIMSLFCSSLSVRAYLFGPICSSLFCLNHFFLKKDVIERILRVSAIFFGSGFFARLADAALIDAFCRRLESALGRK